jgi:hypothetical protein
MNLSNKPIPIPFQFNLRPIYIGPENIKHNAANYTDNSRYQNKRPSDSRVIISCGVAAGVQPLPVKYKSRY